MSEFNVDGIEALLNRRDFLRTAAATGAGLMLTVPGWAQDAPAAKVDELNVAMIGPGSQGRNLLNQCLKIPGIRFKAICDIWPYHQRYAANILKKYDMPVNVYAEYEALLAAEKDLDAVFIATPDWVHAEQTVACLNAGLHVYCEKEMSNTLDGCRQMVQAARDTGKLLQIGHQRRSNPRYWHALKLIEKDKVCGRITHVYGQWNRSVPYELGWPKGKELDQATLDKYGYGTMERFRNWRWYRQFSGGPMADLGSHQVDVFNWFLKTGPNGVLASGGHDYDDAREWGDNVLAIYEYPAGDKTIRGFYQVLSTTSHGGFYETFMGTDGSLVISEDTRKGFMFREVQAKRREWEDEASKVENMGRDAIELKIGETLAPDGSKSPEAQRLLAESQKPPHQLHMENFFNAIRNGTPLSCPPEIAYETAVSVLKANDAVEAGCRVALSPADFKA
jgi:predicted dehydrogenase